MSEVIRLDLSRQRLYIDPGDPLPEFYPTPRTILVTPIYDTPLAGPSSLPDNPELRDSNQSDRHGGPPSPWVVNRSSEHGSSNHHERYQNSSSRRHDDRPYEPSLDDDQRSDPFYPPDPREHHSRSYPRDRYRQRRRYSNDDNDDDDDDDDRYSDYDDRNSADYDRDSSDRDRSHPQRRLTKPYRSSSTTYHEPDKPTQKLTKPRPAAADRDPFEHLKNCSNEIQKILKALPPSPHFCWSACTGRKKAVCIGINYVGSSNSLKGCANDARNMRSFLIKYYKFKSEDILLLTDDGQAASMEPTRKNMLDAMSWLVKDAKIHDSLFFHYSGHGGQVKDETGTEADGMDEVIFPVDFKSTSYIVDNDLFTALVAPLPTGCRLTALFDSCHSGTVLDLPYLHSAHGRLRSLVHITRRALKREVAPSADVICFAACKDDETSADTFEGGIAVGAMSYAFLKILRVNIASNQHLTYEQILKQSRDILIPKYSQKPQISGTHPMDLKREFTL